MRTRLVLFLSIAPVLASAQDAGLAPPAVEAPAAKPTADDFVARLDAFQARRDDPAVQKEIDKTISQALLEYPNSYEILWRAARIRHFVADGATDKGLKQALGKEGWKYADRALKVKGDGYEAHYYRSINIGMYSQSVGILTALSEGLEGQYNAGLDVIFKANERFDRSGPHVAKGRYWWELPWPKRDLSKSREELKKAIAQSPEALRPWLYLADTEYKDGNYKEAKAAIDQVLNGSIDYDPPEGRRMKLWGKDLADKINKELK